VVSSSQITASFSISPNASLGAANVTVSNSGGTSSAVPFTVSLAAPSLVSINPSSGVVGTTIPVTLAGSSFVAGATVTTSSPGISVSNVTVVSSAQITATFSIAANAAVGNFNVSVTTSAGTSSSLPFSITSAPVFTPIRINAGSSTPFTDPLGILWAADSNFTGGGPVSTTNPVNGTPNPALYQTAHFGDISPTLTYQFTVPNGSYTVNLKFDENRFTQAGQRVVNVLLNGQTALSNFDIFARAGALFQALDAAIPVSVTNGQISLQFVSVVSNPRICAIEILAGTPPAPSLSSLSVTSAAAGASVPLTLTGSNLNSDAVINAGPNITVSNIAVLSSTQLTATFTVAATASGTTNVTVTTAGGTTAPLVFTIGSTNPSIASISPASGLQGATVPVTINGSNFLSGASVAVSNPGVAVSNVTVVSASQITASFTIAANAAPGNANVTVTTSNGTSAPAGFAVIPPPPALTAITPASATQGAMVPVTISGSNFTASATVSVSSSGVTVSNVSVASASQLTATFTIAANAITGSSNVTVSTSGGTSSPVTFVINPGPPTLSSVTPASGVQGTTVPVTLNGSGFLAGAALAVSNPGVAVSNVTVVSASQITASFTIAANAATGNANITVTTSTGTSGSVAFSITAPAVFTPIRINAGSTTPFTDPLGIVWAADSNFTGGGPVSNTNPVNGTPNPALYQTAHYGDISPTLTYQFTVPNGSYTVNLKFDENGFTQAGQRVFNVVVNGQTALPNFDIFARAGALFQAVDAAIPVTVSNGQISIQLVSVLRNPRICAIEILAGTSPAPSLSSLSAVSGSPGTAVPVTLTGGNFSTDLVINAGPGIAVSNVNLVSPSQITATFSIASNAALGTNNVTVSAPGGTTIPLPFTIQ
jgi:hypothetical protein